MDLPALIAFQIHYAHVNDYRDLGGNEQNKIKTQAAHKAKNKYTQPLRDRVKWKVSLRVKY